MKSPSTLPQSLIQLIERGASLVYPPTAAELGIAAVAVEEACCKALAKPIAAPVLASCATHASSVALIISDGTRNEPRQAMVRAVRDTLAHVPDEQITLVIASGTHAPRPASTVLGADLIARHPVVVHDGNDLSALVDLGTTARGTRVRIHAALARADLIVSTGRIRPHYFAGYSGGAKGIFPGCAFSADARTNHRLKAHPSARLGNSDDNICRLDMEEAAGLLSGATYLLNVIADREGVYVDAVAGDLIHAHRTACQRASRWFVASGPCNRVVVTSDQPPVTSSLYQASKLLPPAGPLLKEGGTVIMLADCQEGTGPLDIVNHGIYELGIRHHLPREVTVRLVSELPKHIVATTYAHYAASLYEALHDAGFDEHSQLSEVTVLWGAGELIAHKE